MAMQKQIPRNETGNGDGIGNAKSAHKIRFQPGIYGERKVMQQMAFPENQNGNTNGHFNQKFRPTQRM